MYVTAVAIMDPATVFTGNGDDRGIRVWTQIGLVSRGAPFAIEHVCSAILTDIRVDGVSVTLAADTSVKETIYTTDAMAGRLQDWQQTYGEGPSGDARVLGGPVLVPDLDAFRAVSRWPVFAPEASAVGVKAMFALPIQVGAIRFGVLDLYRNAPGALTTRELADALAYADAACMLMLAEAEGGPTDAADLTWHLDDHSTHQVQVHQATGMILVQLGVTAEIALARLRAYAYANGLRLGEVAREVVERRLRFEPDPLPERDDGT